MLIAPSSTTVQAVLVCAIGAVVLAPLVWRASRHRFDLFEPIVIFAVAYGVMFVVRPAAMIIRDERFFFGTRHTIDVSDTTGAMLFLALVGAVAFVIGYELVVRRSSAARRPSRDRYVDQRAAVAMCLVVAAVAIGSFIVFLATADGIETMRVIIRGDTSELKQEIKGTSTYLWLAWFSLAPAAVVLFALGLHRRNAVVVGLSAFLSVLLLLVAVPAGSRIILLPFLGALFVLYYLRRLTRPHVLLVVLVAVAALVGSTILRDVRNRETRGESIMESVMNVATQPGWIYDPILSGPDTEMAPALAAALKFIPSSLSYAYGGNLLQDLVTRPVPRTLWPDKPLPPREKLLSKMLPDEYRDGSINAEFSVLLYFYWDFGLAGVVVGLMVFGVGSRILYEHLQHNERTLSTQVIYSLSVWLIPVALRDSPVDTLITAAVIVLPAWLILRISTHASRTRAEIDLEHGHAALIR
jgi:O-antigen polysaccharide polymerase Wzy